MICSIRNRVPENHGYVLIMTMMLLLLLTVIGIAATRTTNVEVRIAGNYKKMVQAFYASEGALISTLEHHDGWFDKDFANDNADAASWAGMVDFDRDTISDALVEIRRIEQTPADIEGLSNAANTVPADLHISPPPPGSGYSARHFVIRKYAVTATALPSGTTLQAGVWKAFNKH